MSVTIKGDKELANALRQGATLKAQKAIVSKHTSKLQSRAQSKAVFTKGFSTGATKRSISLSIEDGGLTGKVKAGTDYSGYLEVGTRKMSAQPFMRPAFEEVEKAFLEDLRKAGLHD